MKNTAINILLFSIVTTCISCSKISENIEQDIIVNDTAFFDIPVINSITTTTPISGIPFTLNLEEEVKSGLNKYTIDQIKSTKLRSMNLSLAFIGKDTSGKDSLDTKNNFGNLESVKFRIAANSSLANLANTTITSSGTIGALALTPVIVPDSLRTFITNPTKTYHVIIKAKAITTLPMRVRATSTYTITLAK
ncbi:hypothetical protein ABDJ41_06795 [Pedobacter sp. ASV1-7]|uniref:hypothetical protein n=1 Tax=Pedobacter sp. ASV1-7 TaxID=3145237 RepID=UPI0032E8E305